jgi:hypothetical protein
MFTRREFDAGWKQAFRRPARRRALALSVFQSLLGEVICASLQGFETPLPVSVTRSA